MNPFKTAMEFVMSMVMVQAPAPPPPVVAVGATVVQITVPAAAPVTVLPTPTPITPPAVLPVKVPVPVKAVITPPVKLPATKLARPHPNALKPEGIPLLRQQQQLYWPDHPYPATLAAQIDKETCVNNKVCWTQNASLRTEREYGFSYGQFTVAYNKDGSERFNAWREMRDRNPVALKEWTWDNRLDPVMGMRAMILYDYQLFRTFLKASPDVQQVLRFSYSAYNGGAAGLNKDIRLCSVTPNCDPKSWQSKNGKLGVEATSTKSRAKWKGYGESAYDINRGYVKQIVEVRSPKYAPYFTKDTK